MGCATHGLCAPHKRPLAGCRLARTYARSTTGTLTKHSKARAASQPRIRVRHYSRDIAALSCALRPHALSDSRVRNLQFTHQIELLSSIVLATSSGEQQRVLIKCWKMLRIFIQDFLVSFLQSISPGFDGSSRSPFPRNVCQRLGPGNTASEHARRTMSMAHHGAWVRDLSRRAMEPPS